MSAPDRPDVLIDASARMVAARGADGRLSILGAAADRFAARIWLAADGDARLPSDKDLAAGFACDREGCVGRLHDGTAIALPRTLAALEEDCARAALVVTRLTVPMACAARRIDPAALKTSGALALTHTADGWTIAAAHDGVRQRPWTVRAEAPPHRPPTSATAPGSTATAQGSTATPPSSAAMPQSAIPPPSGPTSGPSRKPPTPSGPDSRPVDPLDAEDDAPQGAAVELAQ